eukprot:2182580-Pyramimonas_sp.AAC.1
MIWNDWHGFHAHLTSLMNQELAALEKNLRDPEGNLPNNADFHLMRIRRLAKAWKTNSGQLASRNC